MNAREIAAINRLREAQARYGNVNEQFKDHSKARNTQADLSTLAAFNELESALFPFATGEYEIPDELRGPSRHLTD